MEISYSYIWREGNDVADRLANMMYKKSSKIFASRGRN